MDEVKTKGAAKGAKTRTRPTGGAGRHGERSRGKGAGRIADASGRANWIGEELHEAHRGVIRIKDESRFVLFGNDGYSKSDRVRQYVDCLQGWLKANGYAAANVSVCDEGYTWVIELAPDQLTDRIAVGEVWSTLSDKVWLAWEMFYCKSDGGSFGELQRGIAQSKTDLSFTSG